VLFNQNWVNSLQGKEIFGVHLCQPKINEYDDEKTVSMNLWVS